MQAAPIAFGLASSRTPTTRRPSSKASPPEDFEPREEQLLVEARRLLPRLPLRKADLLIVDEIGKDISGSGMDTNVVGRKRAFRMQPSPDGQPNMRLIFVRGLSEQTHGNAAGIGLADFTTTRLVAGDELPGHRHQLPDGRLSRRRDPAGPLRHATAR